MSFATVSRLTIAMPGRFFLLGIRLRRILALMLALAFVSSLVGYGLYQSKTAFVWHLAVVVTGSPSLELMYQLQFHTLTFINIKVAIHPKDADLILEIIQEAPNS